MPTSSRARTATAIVFLVATLFAANACPVLPERPTGDEPKAKARAEHASKPTKRPAVPEAAKEDITLPRADVSGNVPKDALDVSHVPAGLPTPEVPAAKQLPVTPILASTPAAHDNAASPFTDRLADGGEGPTMVVVPAGRFEMGDDDSPATEERPRHTVVIAKSFAMGAYEVTFDDYDRYARAANADLPADSGWGRGTRPVINVSWIDAQSYTAWLSKQSGKHYRLPTEAEWEYVARAGTHTAYWLGDDIGRSQANCDGCGSPWDKISTAPVGSFQPNRFGAYDVDGNVWEWVQDCAHSGYLGAPTDGSAWIEPSCELRVLRGGSYATRNWSLRSASRASKVSTKRFRNDGLRVARDFSNASPDSLLGTPNGGVSLVAAPPPVTAPTNATTGNDAGVAAPSGPAAPIADVGMIFSNRLTGGGDGPKMIIVPAGQFAMGSSDDVGGSDEHPRHTVTFLRSFAVGVYEVTFDDYDRYARATAIELPRDGGWGRGTRPVTNVNWFDAQGYVRWLSAQTGKRYRLPTEAEWEYVARADSRTKYWWGDEVDVGVANCRGCGSQMGGTSTAPVGSFHANSFGLFDTAGNVWEWVEDCAHDTYVGAPVDGGAWSEGGCEARVIRGGSWYYDASFLATAIRGRAGGSVRSDTNGFRLVQDLGVASATAPAAAVGATSSPPSLLLQAVPDVRPSAPQVNTDTVSSPHDTDEGP